jgi:predicted nicotinamide N-methyase
MSSCSDSDIYHNVQGIKCREVHIPIKNIKGDIVILEATAESQDELVEIACATEEEEASMTSKKLNLIQHSDPYGAVLWPAASAVSDYLMTNMSVKGLTILELGTGTGLCALTAALGGASKVLATDYEEIPLRLLEFAAKHVNNNVSEGNEDRRSKLSVIETGFFDICDHDVPLPKADVVIAADIMYEPKTGIAAALRTVEALKAGSRVVIGCSPGRPGRPYYTDKLKELIPGITAEFEQVQGRTCAGPRNELICGSGSTSISLQPQPLNVELIDLCREQCWTKYINYGTD